MFILSPVYLRIIKRQPRAVDVGIAVAAVHPDGDIAGDGREALGGHSGTDSEFLPCLQVVAVYVGFRIRAVTIVVPHDDVSRDGWMVLTVACGADGRLFSGGKIIAVDVVVPISGFTCCHYMAGYIELLWGEVWDREFLFRIQIISVEDTVAIAMPYYDVTRDNRGCQRGVIIADGEFGV